VPKKRDHRAEKQLDNRDGISGWSIDDGDSERRRGVERDIVDADAGAANHFQSACLLQEVRRYARRTAAYDCVVVNYPFKELLLGQSRHFVDDELRLGQKDCDTFGIDFIGDENAISHYSEPDLRGRDGSSISLGPADPHKRGARSLAANPAFPGVFVRPNNQLIRVPHQRDTEQQGLHGELLEPPVVRKLRIPEAELVKALGFLVH
jgi:hypothetical protein